MHKNHLSPPLLPTAWACDFGEDQYGSWMAFSYKEVRQVFRWIIPGTFMMGSPNYGDESLDFEAFRQVKLTNGFWLADTSVTQALWQAVMDNNPSWIKGDNRPVNNVSWNDALEFIKKLNAIFQDLQSKSKYRFRLPSEAEWEYSCRAGTQTPFNFKGELGQDKVNYHGMSSDYNNGEKGALRETAKVKSDPCNNWGLYEMHGNVWEWCQDGWKEKLGKRAVVNPVYKPAIGTIRVLRGGFWHDEVEYSRSADHRSRFVQNYRHSDIGFRFALGLHFKHRPSPKNKKINIKPKSKTCKCKDIPKDIEVDDKIELLIKETRVKKTRADERIDRLIKKLLTKIGKGWYWGNTGGYISFTLLQCSVCKTYYKHTYQSYSDSQSSMGLGRDEYSWHSLSRLNRKQAKELRERIANP